RSSGGEVCPGSQRIPSRVTPNFGDMGSTSVVPERGVFNRFISSTASRDVSPGTGNGAIVERSATGEPGGSRGPGGALIGAPGARIMAADARSAHTNVYGIARTGTGPGLIVLLSTDSAPDVGGAVAPGFGSPASATPVVNSDATTSAIDRDDVRSVLMS